MERSAMKYSLDLSGKKVLVGGGAGDLGGAMVDALSDAGADVAVLDCLRDMEEWVRCHRKEHAALLVGIRADLADRADLVRAFNEALQILGGLDILVNCQSIQRR